MTIVGTMTCYRCDHPGCDQGVTCSDRLKDGTGWQFGVERAGRSGMDLCPEHKPGEWTTEVPLEEFVKIMGWPPAELTGKGTPYGPRKRPNDE